MFNFLGLLKWSLVVDLDIPLFFNFEERFFEVNATLIVSVQCFFLILICPEHKVFPCEVIYMIVSFYFYSLRGPHPISKRCQTIFYFSPVLFFTALACADFRHHMKIAQYNWIEYKTGNNLVLSCDTKKYRYLPYRQLPM
jgi:hypothetical protein